MNDLNNLSVTTFGEDLKLKGKVIANDGVMVVNDPYDKKLTVIDITDLNDPHIVFPLKLVEILILHIFQPIVFLFH